MNSNDRPERPGIRIWISQVVAIKLLVIVDVVIGIIAHHLGWF
jgi:hypothetical protein